MHFYTKAKVKDFQVSGDKKTRNFKDKVRTFLGGVTRNRIVLFGAGLYGRMVLALPEVNPGSIKYVVDNNPSKWGTSLEASQLNLQAQ